MAEEWSNWSGALTSRPAALHFIRSEADAQALVAQAKQTGQRIRTAGASHSHAPLVQTDDIIADARGLAGVVSVDRDAGTAWVRAGTRIYALGAALHEYGLALINQGDIDQQAIAGATATGTHGTGTALRNLSSAVVGAKLVVADGDLITCGPQERAPLWQAARLHLGALGLVTQLKLQLRPAYRLQEQVTEAPLAQALEGFAQAAAQHRHHEFFWYPGNDRAVIKSISETDAPAVYPVGSEGARCAWSHEVLPNHRPHKHTEMEYSVPAEAGPECMLEIQHLLQRHFNQIRWPVEYRTLAADDVWLSTANGRDTVTISVHQDINEPDEPYFRACEEIFVAFGGRPHWGKVNYLNSADMARCHPNWDDWWQVRDAIDPDQIFLNSYLRNLR